MAADKNSVVRFLLDEIDSSQGEGLGLSRPKGTVHNKREARLVAEDVTQDLALIFI